MANIGRSEEFADILSRFANPESAWIGVDFGWSGLVRDCHNKLFDFDPNYKILQIKEKFGGLRYYFEPSFPAYTHTMRTKVLEMEKQSFAVCELCGENGKLRKTKKTNWYKTLCEKHTDTERYVDSVGALTQVDLEKVGNALSLYPIVIRESRYSGTYEGGEWHAIPNCEGGDAWNGDYFDYLYGDDDGALNFWQSDAAKLIGIGDTPNDALKDLFKKNFQ